MPPSDLPDLRAVRAQHDRAHSRSTWRSGEYTAEEQRFVRAMDAYKRVNRRPYPHWTEVLAVVRALGYRLPEEEGPEVPGDGPCILPMRPRDGPGADVCTPGDGPG